MQKRKKHLILCFFQRSCNYSANFFHLILFLFSILFQVLRGDNWGSDLCKIWIIFRSDHFCPLKKCIPPFQCMKSHGSYVQRSIFMSKVGILNRNIRIRDGPYSKQWHFRMTDTRSYSLVRKQRSLNFSTQFHSFLEAEAKD